MFKSDKESGSHIVLSPKMSFILGLVGGVMLLCTIGFFITLTMLVKGMSSGAGALKANTQPTAAAPSADPSADPSGAGEQVGTVAPVDQDDHVWGSDSASVTLIEYSDFECPYCARFADTIDQIKANYVGKVRIVYRHFPLSFHPGAQPAALASECAAEQGKFWEYHDELFTTSDGLTESTFKSIAADLGLNKTKFANCLSNQTYLSKVNADRSSGSTAGISGTPGTIIIASDGSKQLIPGALPYDQVKPMIDAALQ